MRRLFLAALLATSFLLAAPALAEGPDDDDSALVAPDDDDSALVAPDDDDSAILTSAVPDALPQVTDVEAVAAVKTLLDYQRSGWGALVAALLTLLVFVARKFKLLSKLPKEALPWVAAAVAMTGDASVALAAGSSVPDALLQGLMLGAAAVGFWEMAGKKIQKVVSAKSPDGK